MKVLAIGCHPDDMEICCAGTLAKYVKLGHEVTVCHCCNGNMGHVVIMPDELRVIRINEAKKAGAMAGIKVRTIDVGDLVIYHQDKETRDKLVQLIREEHPDVIITHAPNDYMPDHIAVSNLVFDAAFAATCAHYENPNGLPAAECVPIYYMDNLAGMNFVPTIYVDISDTIELKLQMLECHESQLKWMRDHDNIDFADLVRTSSRYRGYQCGCAYAEGFTECGAYLKMGTKRLLP